MMLLRVQHERHDHYETDIMKEYHEKHGLTVEREKRMKRRKHYYASSSCKPRC